MPEDRRAQVLRSDPGIGQIAKKMGVNHNLVLADFSKFHGVLEAPIQIADTKFRHKVSFGAFSYVTGGFLFNTEVGRYCSLSNGLHIGQEGHPTDWLSTNPFQYQRPPFNLGPDFMDTDLFEADQQLVAKRYAEKISSERSQTKIGNDVWLAHGVYVKNGVTIGDGAVVGARSVVTKDIPPYAIAYGTPARVARLRFSEDIVERLLNVRWWRYAPWQLRDVTFDEIEVAVAQLEALRASDAAEYVAQSLEIRVS